jgi:hypothetical protein
MFVCEGSVTRPLRRQSYTCVGEIFRFFIRFFECGVKNTLDVSLAASLIKRLKR